jgi:LacI family transcriptional regulator
MMTQPKYKRGPGRAAVVIGIALPKSRLGSKLNAMNEGSETAKDQPRQFRSGPECTINDVASAAQTSIRTVSRVLNHSPKVNQETRKRIEAAIATLGFHPNVRARGLATRRSYLIGVVHNDRNALVVDSVHRGIVSEAGQRGYELIVHPTPSDGGSTEEIIGFVRRSHVDGLIILPPVWAMPGLSDALADAAVPTVIFSAVPIDGYSATLMSNERRGAAEVATHLLACGHRRIALVSGPADVHSARERRGGFIETLMASGCALIGETEGDYGFQSGVAAAERLMALEPRPTAIFAANDVMAAGVLKAAAALGLAVPDDLSVVGFDGSQLAEMVTPALTTVKRPLGDMAQRATGCLIDMIEGVETATDLRAELSLILRESSGPAPA